MTIKNNTPLNNPTLGKFILSPQEKRQGVSHRIRIASLPIQRQTLCILKYPYKTFMLSGLVFYDPFMKKVEENKSKSSLYLGEGNVNFC
jgi:hypothetical protein